MRAATPDDLETVVALRLALVREEANGARFRRLRADAAERAVAVYAGQLADISETTYLALDGDRAVGILRCTESCDSALLAHGRYAYITSAYVVPEYRRRGVLRALLRAADRWCHARGLADMRLQCNFENELGNAAWSALGFAPIDIRRRRVVPALSSR